MLAALPELVEHTDEIVGGGSSDGDNPGKKFDEGISLSVIVIANVSQNDMTLHNF